MPDYDTAEWATIGKIVAFFGLRGELKVLSLSDVPDRFAQLDAVYLCPGYVRYAIERVRPYKGNMLVLKLSGVDDINVAEALRNYELCIPLDQLAALPPDSYYQHDIIGLHVSTLDGREVGTITDILVTGGNDVYVVKTASGREVLIPAIKDVVKQVDLRRRNMYIDPMRGLLDDDAAIVSPDNRTEEEE
jgi:16S rRNA processing protein RimM